MTEAAGYWTIYCDLQVTRRKFWFVLCDPAGEQTYFAPHLSEILGWLAQREIEQYVLIANPDRSLATKVYPIFVERSEQWQK